MSPKMQAGAGAESPRPAPALSVGACSRGRGHDHGTGELTVHPPAFRRVRRSRSIYGTFSVFATEIDDLVLDPDPIVDEFAFTLQATDHVAPASQKTGSLSFPCRACC